MGTKKLLKQSIKEKTKMRHNIKIYLMKYKYLITILVFGVLIGFVGENSLVNRYEQKRTISELKQEIKKYQTQFEKDREMLRRIKSDPEAIKTIARERYMMKTENEDIYVIEDE